jgi:hypothetical protein
VWASASARDVIMSGIKNKPPAKAAAHTTPALTIPERILLFCIASGTDWERAGITGSTVTNMIVRGLIRRDPAGRLWLTKDGRAALDALLDDPRQHARNGVRSLDVSCWQCHHRAILSADPWPDHVPVPSFGPSHAVGALHVRK